MQQDIIDIEEQIKSKELDVANASILKKKKRQRELNELKQRKESIERGISMLVSVMTLTNLWRIQDQMHTNSNNK